MPFFGDQLRNALITESLGYGLKQDFTAITEETLKDRIEELISNKKYRQKAKEISEVFNDNPRKPMVEAMYWIEYVARHKGAKHLKSAAIKLSWYQRLSLDVVGFYLFLIVAICYTILKIVQIFVRFSIKKLTRNNQNDKKNK